jgi:hypothetical protein
MTRVAWSDALDSWVNKFGNEEFVAEFSGIPVRFKLEASTEDLLALAGTPENVPVVRQAVDSYQKMVNYRYWRTRGQSEADTETADAHRNLYEAGEHFKKQNLQEALPLIEASMGQFERVLSKYPNLRESDEMIEECMLAVKMWSDIYRLQGDKLPQEFPLRPLWMEQQGRMPNIDKEFRRRFLTTSG